MYKNSFLKYLAIASILTNLQAQTYTLDELIDLSIKNAPDLQISQANYQASQSRYKAARGSYLPQVNLQASAGRVGISDFVSQNSDATVQDTVYMGQLSVNQILYDFGKRSGSVDSFSYDSSAYKLQNRQEISDKIKDVKVAYYQVLQAQALIVVQKENIKLNEAQLYRSKKYFQAGIRTKIDVSDAQVSLIKAKLSLKSAEYDLKLAYTTLNKVIGAAALDEEYTLQEHESSLNYLLESVNDYDFSLNELIEYAYKNRASLQKFNAQIESVKSKISLYDSEYFPELFLNANYKQQELQELRTVTPREQWQATINLDWNLYSGGATDAKVAENRSLANASEQEYLLAKLTVKKEVTDAYIEVSKSKDFILLAQSLVEVSAQKFDQASKRYENGLSDYIELQQARQDYIDAKATLVSDFYDYYMAIAKMDNTIGR